jgi:hypothetical protein
MRTERVSQVVLTVGLANAMFVVRDKRNAERHRRECKMIDQMPYTEDTLIRDSFEFWSQERVILRGRSSSEKV